jgi:chaperonin cofactor prefoldin
MKDYYSNLAYYILCFLVVAGVVLLTRKIEHLTMEEVDEKAGKLTERVNTLEDEYKQLQVKLDNQSSKMEFASKQAEEARAFLNPTD